MQRRIKTICLVLVWISLSLAHDVSAQFSPTKKKWRYKNRNNRISFFEGRKLIFANTKEYVSLGVSLNALNYFGDIAPKSGIVSTDVSFTRPGLGISSTARLSPSLAVRAEFLYGRLSSSDYKVADPSDELAIYRYVRNLHFRNNIKDFSLVGVYDIFDNPGAVMFRMNFTPYIFAGISVFHHNPKAKVPEQALLYPNDTISLPEAGKWVALRGLHTEGKENTYSSFQVSVPFGVGARFRISQLMDLEAEVNYRYLFTDYIDDVSSNYVDKGTLESDLAKVMSDRSLELVDAVTGKERFQALVDSELINTKNITTYTGADGQQYLTLPGYGQPAQQRGGRRDNDIFITTSVRLIFIIGRSPFIRKRR